MADVLATAKTVLEGGWSALATDDITPTVDIIANFDIKTLDLNNKDYVFLYEVSESIVPSSLGGTTFNTVNTISLDLRTTFMGAALSARRAHIVKMKDEALRIFKSKLKAPDANFQLLVNYRRRDYSNKFGICQMIYDVDFKNFGVS